MNEKMLIEFIGFIFLLSFIWVIFIYKRLPRDIPFNLSLISLIGLSLICILCAYYIYRIYKPSISNEWINVLRPLAQLLLKPILQFNHFLLSKEITRNVMKILLILLYKNFKIHLIHNNKLYIHAFLTIIPQIIIVICLIIDCFYFKKLYLIYTCVLIITYPLIVRYLMYIYETIRLYDTELLDKYFIIEITSEDIIYKENDYDEEGFLKSGLPTHYTDPSHLQYDSFETYDKNYEYFKTLKFIDHQESALICNDLLYEYKILFQNERKDVFFLEEVKMPTNINKNTCDDLLQFHINISFLSFKIKHANEYFRNYYINLHKVVILLKLLLK
jgi:hypothetical protein